MNLDQLQVFLAVARHLHFSRAAEELYITQPAVSASVAKLENHFGVKLFHRIGRRVELTDAGRFLLEEGPRLLDGVDRLERGLQEFTDLRRGVLSLGASFTVGNYWLPSRLSRFGDLHPEIELRCTLGNADQVLEGTARGQFDLCFLSGWADQENSPGLEAHLSAAQVGQERLQVVVGHQHPWFGVVSIPGSHLCQSVWIVREQGSGAQRLLEKLLKQVGVDPASLEVRLVLNSSEMVKAVVLSGSGAAALPETMITAELAQGLLWAVTIEGSPHSSQPIWMVKHDQRYPSSLLRAFEAVIEAERTPPSPQPASPHFATTGAWRRPPGEPNRRLHA
ncbi:MAG: LysR family transcriptional regulator [Cyanobium sp.]